MVVGQRRYLRGGDLPATVIRHTTDLRDPGQQPRVAVESRRYQNYDECSTQRTDPCVPRSYFCGLVSALTTRPRSGLLQPPRTRFRTASQRDPATPRTLECAGLDHCPNLGGILRRVRVNAPPALTRQL